MSLTKEQLKSLNIEELPSELTTEEEELRRIKEQFSRAGLIPFSFHSPHAVRTADLLINRGFDGFLKGKSLDDLAQWELDQYFELTFQHPDALEGLTAYVERRTPKFNRT
jgi:hypothetical protein